MRLGHRHLEAPKVDVLSAADKVRSDDSCDDGDVRRRSVGRQTHRGVNQLDRYPTLAGRLVDGPEHRLARKKRFWYEGRSSRENRQNPDVRGEVFANGGQARRALRFVLRIRGRRQRLREVAQMATDVAFFVRPVPVGDARADERKQHRRHCCAGHCSLAVF
ncbi:MAG: hypothetical protein DMF90_15970 [Acidobacteria bacterium]|nr:MAG: hypothetical protein DMF90_15970 [Acidobacteriota bacterium]